MAIYHLTTKPLSRSSGRSAVAAAAYRTGDRLVDERQGLMHDYTKRFGVAHEEVVLPEEADAGQWTRQQLWNAAELAENRKDARTAREWLVALPEELGEEGRKALALGFARELADRYGCAVDVGIHLPDKEGDQRNHHAHLLATTRVLAGQGMGDKTQIELSDAKRLSLGLGQARQEIEQVRELWAKRANEALEKHGREERIDHRSLAAQQQEAVTAGDVIRAAVLDRMPEIKLGWKAAAVERRGEATDRGDQLRDIRKENGLRAVALRQLDKLKQIWAELIQRLKGERTQKEREEQERKQQRHVAAVAARAEVLWMRSDAGRSEAGLRDRLLEDQRLQQQYAGELATMQAAQETWKMEHRLQAMIYENPWQDQVKVAKQRNDVHMLQMENTRLQMNALSSRKQSAWSSLEDQAKRDLQVVQIKLKPEDVELLLRHQYSGNKEEAVKVFSQIEQRTHTVLVLNGQVKLHHSGEKDGFVATLRRMDAVKMNDQLTYRRAVERGEQLSQERERTRQNPGHGGR